MGGVFVADIEVNVVFIWNSILNTTKLFYLTYIYGFYSVDVPILLYMQRPNRLFYCLFETRVEIA